MEKVLKICKLKLMTNDYTENMYDFFFPYGTISWKNNVLLLNFCWINNSKAYIVVPFLFQTNSKSDLQNDAIKLCLRLKKYL